MSILNQEEVKIWVQGFIVSNNLHAFYTSSEWLRLRKEVLKEHKYECQHCKQKGFYKKADTVHHVQYVKKHPALALSKTYIFQGKEYKNLIPLCHNCHEVVHSHRRKSIKKPLTVERW
ncbi:MAG: HNH endonuclease [Firmicutes bacterium]|nr:HNH endonuclease [Bacillota bacterium]